MSIWMVSSSKRTDVPAYSQIIHCYISVTRLRIQSHRPNETARLLMSQLYHRCDTIWLGGRDREGGISLVPKGSHLFYTISLSPHEQAAVKVHRVLPSFPGNSASARRFQFHWVCAGDSGAVVTPFMQVRTYLTRNFAQFLPSLSARAGLYLEIGENIVLLFIL